MFNHRKVGRGPVVHTVTSARDVTERPRGPAQVAEVEGLGLHQLLPGPREHHVHGDHSQQHDAEDYEQEDRDCPQEFNLGGQDLK